MEFEDIVRNLESKRFEKVAVTKGTFLEPLEALDAYEGRLKGVDLTVEYDEIVGQITLAYPTLLNLKTGLKLDGWEETSIYFGEICEVKDESGNVIYKREL